MSNIELENITRESGNLPVWVEFEGKRLTGNSFDLCLTFASGMNSTRVFPCYDEVGDFYQLWPEQITDYGIL